MHAKTPSRLESNVKNKNAMAGAARAYHRLIFNTTARLRSSSNATDRLMNEVYSESQ